MSDTCHVPVEDIDGHVECVEVVVSYLLEFNQELNCIIAVNF